MWIKNRRKQELNKQLWKLESIQEWGGQGVRGVEENELYLYFETTLFERDIVRKVFLGCFPEQNRQCENKGKLVVSK